MSLPEKTPVLIDQLAIQIYQEPLATLWGDRRSLPDVVRTVVLIIDYDTEVAMNGLLGLFENSIGEYLPEIISALAAVGAERTASALHEIDRVLGAQGFGRSKLRDNLNAMDAYTITTFARTHGPAAGDTLSDASRIHSIAAEAERPLDLLDAYVIKHQAELRRHVNLAFDEPAG